MRLSDTWIKVSEAVDYIHARYGVYMDVQWFWKLHNRGGHFELRKFPGQPWRVNKDSIDKAYEGEKSAAMVVAEAEAAEAAEAESEVAA